MSLNPEDKNSIHRYLNGELTGIELDQFSERMNQDKSFKEEVNFQKLLHLGILFSKEEDLKKKVVEKIRFRKPKIPFALKLIVTFLIVTGMGITLWFYVGPDSSIRNKGNSFLTFLSKGKKSEKKNEDSKNNQANATEHSSGNVKQQAEEPSDGTSPDQSSPEGAAKDGESQGEQNQPPADSVSQSKSEDDDIVIKKEKLLISALVPVIEKPIPDSKLADASQNSSLTQDAVQKLNPSAGVPEEEKAVSNYQVEFWISPINYHGYKMSRNKLIIYGIDEPDALKLYRLNDALFMKYGNEFFHLVTTFEYIPYQRLKDSDVPLAIRQ